MTTIDTARRVGLAGCAAALALALSAGPSMATEISHTGKIGDHQLNDGPGNAGMVCDYQHPENGDNLVGFELVMPPTIWSRDRTSGRDKQKVGWRYTILRRHNNGKWKNFYQSSIVKANAWNDQSAYFLTRTPTSIMVPLDISPDHSAYKVRITQYWYKPSGAVAGTALSQVDTVAESNDSDYIDLGAQCSNRFLN